MYSQFMMHGQKNINSCQPLYHISLRANYVSVHYEKYG